jgi:hypothetical protein
VTRPALRAVAVVERDLYVTEPAATPRCVWFDEEPINWSALVPERAPSSGVRRMGEMDLRWEETRPC